MDCSLLGSFVSWDFLRQEHWNRVAISFSWESFLDSRIKPTSPIWQADPLPLGATWGVRSAREPIFTVLRHPVCGNWLWQPQETHITGNSVLCSQIWRSVLVSLFSIIIGHLDFNFFIQVINPLYNASHSCPQKSRIL